MGDMVYQAPPLCTLLNLEVYLIACYCCATYGSNYPCLDILISNKDLHFRSKKLFDFICISLSIYRSVKFCCLNKMEFLLVKVNRYIIT